MTDRTPSEIIRGLTLPDTPNEVTGGASINVNEAWREFIRTYGQADDASRFTRGPDIPIGGSAVITVGLETLLGLPGGAGMPGSFLQPVSTNRVPAEGARSRTWGETGGEGEALEWPEGTSHVRLVAIRYRTNAGASTGARSPWAFTELANGEIESFYSPYIGGQGGFLPAEYGSDNVVVARIATTIAAGPWRPIEEYPNGWAAGVQAGGDIITEDPVVLLQFDVI